MAAPGTTAPGPVVSYLTDFGIGLGIANVITLRPAYPTMTPGRTLINFRTNVQLPVGVGVLPPGSSVLVELLRSNVPVRATLYAAGSAGGQLEDLGSVPYAPGDEIDVRVSATGFIGVTLPINVTATAGVGP